MKPFLATIGLSVAFSSTPAALAEQPAPKVDLTAVAECVVDNDFGDVRVLLGTIPGSREEKAAAVKVLDYYGGCADNTPVAGDLAWRERAEIAHAALMKRLGRGPTDAVAASTRVGWSLIVPATAAAGSDYNSSSVGMRQLGDCIAGKAPGAALALVRSDAGSANEAQAIDLLAPTIAPCVTAGQNLRVKRQDLRLIVAEPLYHMLSR